ncbi:MAG: hypothetical protein U0794_16955 [Isosphaeraceae bacterium]
MANAQVEKLKALGLRHGEKAVVALAAALCLLLLVSAVMKPTIDLTPADVDKHATAAQSNIDTKQDPDNILKLIEDAGIKNPGFEALVDTQAKSSLNPNDYRIDHAWVTPEPGAGLIRDTPQLIAPIELAAYPGRGGALVFALDETGKRILDEGDKQEEDPTTKLRRGRKRNRSMSGYGMMGMGGMPGMGMGMGGNLDPESEEAKKEFARKEKLLKGALVGKVDPNKEKAKEKGKEGENAEETPEQGGPWKEVTKGLRWVAITGVLDHKKLKDNYLAALKNPTVAHPNYKQVDIQRQELQPDGSWSDWQDVDIEKNRAVLFNLPETEEELAASESIIETIVDPLPFLKAGLWEKVHVASLVPKEKREIEKPAAGIGGMMGAGGMPGMEGMYSGMSRGGMGGMMGAGGMPGMMGAGGMPGMEGMSGMGMGMGMGGGDENLNFQKTEAESVMVRSLDLTADPDATYRFRLRIVVYNPNYKREDVSPGVDTKSLELKGPWSEPTEPVTMPADVTTYAMRKAPADGSSRRTDQVQFQVTRWTPEDGVTVVRNFNAGPGEVVGDPATASIPVSDGSGAKNKLVDFNSHLLVLDTAGGPRPIAPLGASGAPLDVPATTLLMKPDGTVIVRNQANDIADAVRKDMAENYAREVKESSKRRESSFGAGMGMYGGMGGMMKGGSR